MSALTCSDEGMRYREGRIGAREPMSDQECAGRTHIDFNAPTSLYRSKNMRRELKMMLRELCIRIKKPSREREGRKG